MVVVNVGHPEDSDKLEQVLSATLNAVFPVVMRDPVQSTNTMLIASGAPVSGDALDAAAAGLPPDLTPVARETAQRIAPRLPGGEVYTDDRAPVEWLVDSSILQVAESGRR